MGVVLSGGSARGLAHIGVLEALEAEGIVPDVVTGASMGALVGGLYAIGRSPGELHGIVTSLEWASYFLDEPERRFVSLDRRLAGERTILTLPLKDGHVSLPAGVVGGQRVSELLARLTWPVQLQPDFRRFPKPFLAIATDIETGEAVVLDSGSLAEALRASMSIPSLFDPVRLHGRMLVDGGIARNLPARDARSLGADVVVCSDVAVPLLPSGRLESLVDVLMQTIAIYTDASSAEERRLCDVYIRPDLEGLTAADFDRAEEMIRRGRAAAEAVRPALRAIAARLPARDPAREAAAAPEFVPVDGVLVEGVGGEAERAVHRRLQLAPRRFVSADVLDAAVERVYATEIFDVVRYGLDVRGGDTLVVVTALPREQDHIGFGLRYDDAYEASLLFTLQLRNRIGFGSTSRFDLRLGDQFRIGVDHSNVGIGGTILTAGAAASYSRSPVPLYDGEQQIAEARVEVSDLAAFAGIMLGNRATVGVELKGEHAQAVTTIAATDTSQRSTFGSAAAVLLWNSLDRSAFPTRGGIVSLRSEHALVGDRFAQHVANGLVAVPLARALTLSARATVGSSSTDDALPVHYRFMLGGAFPAPLFPETQVSFVGLRHQERSGTAVVRVGGALQWELRRHLFATVRGDVGYAGDELTVDADAYDAGVALVAGAMTLAGPLELSASWRPGHGRHRLELSLGYPF
ncbi:MAG TPA: patatin-like phospholipase family protein [Gemmatimonadaceae bacterium]